MSHPVDCNPIWWIGLILTIQTQNQILDLDGQSSFVVSIQIQNIRIILSKKLKFHSASCSNNEAKLLFIKIFKQFIYL